jgi:hypothetical protein
LKPGRTAFNPVAGLTGPATIRVRGTGRSNGLVTDEFCVSERFDKGVVGVLFFAASPVRSYRRWAGSFRSSGFLGRSAEGERKYRLIPFLVGWYEANMRLLDKAFGELFE